MWLEIMMLTLMSYKEFCIDCLSLGWQIWELSLLPGGDFCVCLKPCPRPSIQAPATGGCGRSVAVSPGLSVFLQSSEIVY